MNTIEAIKSMKEKNPFISNTDMAYTLILEGIISGMFACAERLNQENLALQYGMSRTPIREALSRLEQEGFVSKGARGQYQVYELEMKDYVDFSEFRICIEGYAAQQAAVYATKEDLLVLENNINVMKQASEKDAYPEFLKADDEFHKLVIQASKNRYLSEVYEMYGNKLTFYRRMIVSKQNLQAIYKRHAQIFHWIVEREEEKARCSMHKHVSMQIKNIPIKV